MKIRTLKRLMKKVRREGPAAVKAFFTQAISGGSKKLLRRHRAMKRAMSPQGRAQLEEGRQEKARVRRIYRELMLMIQVVEQQTGKPLTVEIPAEMVAQVRDQALKAQGAP